MLKILKENNQPNSKYWFISLNLPLLKPLIEEIQQYIHKDHIYFGDSNSDNDRYIV